MAQEVLIMIQESVYRLKNIIASQRFVNCFSREFSPENEGELRRLLSKLKEGYNNLYIEIDIQGFENCENEEEEAMVLLEAIDRELIRQGLAPFQGHAYAMSTALSRWGDTLDKRTVLIFHCFHDRYSEKEKNILRTLRKTLSNKGQLSGYLGILLVSNREVFKWELFPESNLDERHLAFFEIESVEVD
jgi:hypothetical protein